MAFPHGSYSWTPCPAVAAWTKAARCPMRTGATGRPCASRVACASSASEPRAGTPQSTADAGVPASCAIVWEAVTARRSRIDARHGTSTRSAARAAASAGDSACGAVSMRHRTAPCSRAVVRTSASRAAWAETTTGALASRESDQAAALAWGSRSTMSAACPASSAATAKLSARDVLPTPPFCETIAIVSMCP